MSGQVPVGGNGPRMDAHSTSSGRAVGREGAQVQMCDCTSYNGGEAFGKTPERVLNVPKKFRGERPIVFVDDCVADAILMLWEHDIWTEGCCCGHNGRVGNFGHKGPSVVLGQHADATKAIELLRKNDARSWQVLQWRLVDCASAPLREEVKQPGSAQTLRRGDTEAASEAAP